MRVQIEVVRAQTQRRTQDDVVEHGGQSVDDQVCAAPGPNDGPEIPGVRFDDPDLAPFSEEAAGSLDVAVSAPDGVSLTIEELRQQGAGAA